MIHRATADAAVFNWFGSEGGERARPPLRQTRAVQGFEFHFWPVLKLHRELKRNLKRDGFEIISALKSLHLLTVLIRMCSLSR